MDDLVQFLRDRFDEDGQTARDTAWSMSTEIDNPWDARPPRTDAEGWTVWSKGRALMFHDLSEADARHIARHNPSRVLAELDAKLKALDHYEWIREYSQGKAGFDVIFAEGAFIKQIQYMALPYSNHPDYREDWRP